MAKVAIVYWSGTGNTEAMAKAVLDGAKTNGADAAMLTSDEFDPNEVNKYDAFAFGCPAMGAEELEDSSFEPMFMRLLNQLGAKKVGLFGSYGWGDGEWMRTWEQTCSDNNITLAHASVICQETPDAAALEACTALGVSLT